jgi:uncharacterized membrane protein
MTIPMMVHVVSAIIGLLSGTIALCAAKGSRLHRRSGIVFGCSMLTMSLTGAGIAVFARNEGNVIAGLLTAYLVTTGWLTVRRPSPALRRAAIGAMVLAIAIGAGAFTLGLLAFASPKGTRGGIPFVVFFMFGSVALLSALGDFRMIRAGGVLRGVPRLSRHIWRMCYALWIAAASFFLGPRARVAKVLPEPLLHPALLALPVLLVLAAMAYWLWRIRNKRRFAAILRVSTPEAI